MQRALEATVEHLGEIPAELGIKDEMAALQERAQRGRSGAKRQLEVWEETDSLSAVALGIAERTVP